MRFDFRFAPSYRPVALVLGVTPRTAYVDLTDAGLAVYFGLWRLCTPLTNLEGVERSGGFSYLKSAGPPHFSFADHGITFATNGDDAVCVRFREPVKLLDPTGRIRHPGATLTVADPAAFEAELHRLQDSRGPR
jgi:hypothetical protein